MLRDRAEPAYNLGLVLERGGKYEMAKEAYKPVEKMMQQGAAR